MKRREEEMLHNKEQPTVQHREQSSVQPTVQPTIQPTVQCLLQSTVQLNYVNGVVIFAILAIAVCVFFAYNTFQSKNKKSVNENQVQHQNDFMSLKNLYNK